MRPTPSPKPFIIHLARPGDALAYLGEANDFARRMMRKLWPGPVGLIFAVPEARRTQVAAQLGWPKSDLYETAPSRCDARITRSFTMWSRG